MDQPFFDLNGGTLKLSKLSKIPEHTKFLLRDV